MESAIKILIEYPAENIYLSNYKPSELLTFRVTCTTVSLDSVPTLLCPGPRFKFGPFCTGGCSSVWCLSITPSASLPESNKAQEAVT